MRTSGVVEGAPRIVLRLEGLAVLAIATAAYGRFGGSWVLFLALFLVPDLGIAGYLAGPRAGAAAYNVAHSYVGAAALILAGMLGATWLLPPGLVWTAHIGFDRVLGFGLKYPDAFAHTHLGSIGPG